MCDAAGGDMVEFTKTIKDPLGLHARPVALLYDIIAKHRSNVSVSIGDRHTDGRDVMGLMALYGECGEDIIFRVSGVDEASCVTSIRNLSL
ncbi:HPr family phosphocarrier protein [Collinsella sp. AM33-4BH]|jgi:phosphocarrier protein HPr|nr:HPr family phosphocarrier protein [Collinsella sp. AF20-14LB]RGX15511.1 HPr family phosphocarrier protein [Collinsella sp. AF04-24]RHA86346.1 HPr family phosphocarrier protein [Collinsella sp. AM42-18AC]RHB19819.1 HPr family phosphocarrier protein [Collinsella sp. AM40-7AC]RHC93409.1 HPr family phosphocarrier protein [Collinsella sp. AM33-4BH]RHI28453.1 HPr family phosphocarrier protein [Collinsella sp. AM15-2]RHJ58700.1 HPr family phosphocarrier protein [Collinsella sp. AM09-41]